MSQFSRGNDDDKKKNDKADAKALAVRRVFSENSRAYNIDPYIKLPLARA